MEMVSVSGVIVGAEHNGEQPAGAIVHGSQKSALGTIGAPVLADIDSSIIGQFEAFDVDRIRAAVFA